MNTKTLSELADALCQKELLTDDEYAVHRLNISNSLAKLRRRERYSRRVLQVLGMTWIACLLGLMSLDRLPRDLRQQAWHGLLFVACLLERIAADISGSELSHAQPAGISRFGWLSSKTQHKSQLVTNSSPA